MQIWVMVGLSSSACEVFVNPEGKCDVDMDYSQTASGMAECLGLGLLTHVELRGTVCPLNLDLVPGC